ncbi:MAG: hypothetical protein LBE62_15420 [Azonexus sp.]|nr:hypothetical protein [Azonexus sp.]
MAFSMSPGQWPWPSKANGAAIRLRNTALNFSFLRRLAIKLFRADTSRAISLPKKRKAAGIQSISVLC